MKICSLNLTQFPEVVQSLCLWDKPCALSDVMLPWFAFAALLLFSAVLVITWRRRGVLQSLGATRGGVEAPWPVMTTTLGGELLRANDRLDAAGLGGQRSIDAILAALMDIKTPQLYRMSRLCVRSGLALERFPMRSGGYGAVLAQLVENDKIAWQVLPPNQIAKVFPEAGLRDYDDLPFGVLRLENGAPSMSNATFRREYSSTAIERLAELDLSDSIDCGKVLLPKTDGAEITACYLIRRSERAGVQVADIFLSPPMEDAPQQMVATETLEAMPVALVSLDRAGVVLWGNAQAREMIGSGFREGTAFGSIVEPLGRSFSALIEETRGDAGGSGAEMVRMRHDTADKFAQVTLTRMKIRGQDLLLAVLTDASELRQLEDKFAQSHKMEAVGKLAGGVAHDFNNVLTAISGHCDLLLLRKDASHPDFSDLTQIRQNANRAAGLVRQLLAFSRKQTLKPTLLSVQDVVSDTLYLLARLIGESITLTVDHDRELGSVRADHQQLEQALMNLVVNARDAMPNGGSVTLATRNRRLTEECMAGGVAVPAGDYVEISIADTGTGIDPAVIGNVFDPFFTTKPKGEGTGLGLSTVYGIVKQSGGYIYVENQPEGGARFCIFLPRVYPDKQELALQMRAPEPVDGGDLTGQGAVLLVEDEAPVRSFASRALRLRGYRVIEADCAEAAMERLEAGDEVDVLVSDVVMPGMDGPTFAAKARELRPGLRVIFVSGYAEDSFRRNLTDTDFLFLPKPFSLNDLTAKVKLALSNDRAA